jgi:Tripartite tricarboxylate transporter family receptor
MKIHWVGTMPRSLAAARSSAAASRARCCSIAVAKSAGPPKLGSCPVSFSRSSTMAPVGTPQAIVRKISDDLRAVLVKPEIKDKLAARGGYVHPADPAEAEAFVRSQQELWQPALEQVALQFKQK